MTERELRRVFETHQHAVYTFALRFTGSEALAEDIAQECFLSLLGAGSGFDPARGAVRPYLIGMARNLAHRHWREVMRIDSLSEDLPGEEPDLAAVERSRMIAEAVQSLPPLQREAVLLFEYEGFSLDEIARLAGADTGTIKSRLHRARERLRRVLASLRKEIHANADR